MIVEKLEDQRLLTGTGDAVRLAHEQLITAWPRLAQTVTDCREDLLLQARLERQADDWKHGNGELLGRDAAAAASSWLTGRAEPGTDRSAIGDYIRASSRAVRRRRARAVGVLSTVVALALAASVFAVMARIQSSDAVRQSHVAQSEEMAAEATNLFSANAPLAMLLSVQAYKRARTMQARSALIEAARQPLGDLLAEGSTVDSVAFSPDGRTLAAGDSGGHVGLWDTGSGRRSATLAEGSPVFSVAFSPDGRTLAAGDSGGGVGLWDTASGRRTVALAEGSPVYGVAFSPDGRTLAAGDWAAASACGHRKQPPHRRPGRGQPCPQRRVQPGRPDARYWRPEWQCGTATTEPLEFDWRLPLTTHMRRGSQEYDARSMDSEYSRTAVPEDLFRLPVTHHIQCVLIKGVMT